MMDYGAVVEIGKVKEISNGMYKIESEERPGLITPAFPCVIPLNIEDEVAFVMFDDGRGGILWKI